MAAYNGDLAATKAALERGEHIDGTDPYGHTAIFFAASQGHVVVLDFLLLRGAALNQTGDDNVSPLFVAAQDGHNKAVRALLEHGADVDQARTDGTSPLFMAAQEGHLHVVQALLERRVNLDRASNGDGITPLLAACYRGHLGIVKALLARGADVNLERKDISVNPLIAAAEDGYLKIFDVLLEHGADIVIFSRQRAGCHRLAPLFFARLNHVAEARQHAEQGDIDWFRAAFEAGGSKLAPFAQWVPLLPFSARVKLASWVAGALESMSLYPLAKTRKLLSALHARLDIGCGGGGGGGGAAHNERALHMLATVSVLAARNECSGPSVQCGGGGCGGGGGVGRGDRIGGGDGVGGIMNVFTKGYPKSFQELEFVLS